MNSLQSGNTQRIQCWLTICVLFASFSSFTGCRSTYYAAWEKFGKQKRDLLKSNVEAARDGQEKAAEQFKDTLTRLKELYQFEGGDLEKVYSRLKNEFDRSESRAKEVRNRIQKVEQIAADMFQEWEKEITSMKSERLAAGSREQLRLTRSRYETLHQAMTRAESSMQPVLSQLQDQVLYLKHHLNAQAVGALKTEAANIEEEIQRLIRDMNKSIQEANAFVKNFESAK
jgi:hypothetical protein